MIILKIFCSAIFREYSSTAFFLPQLPILFLKSFFIATLLLAAFILLNGCSKKEDESKIQITTSSEEARAEFLKGRDLFEKLRGQESLQHFENAIAKDKDFAFAYYYHSLSNPTTKGFFDTESIKIGTYIIIGAFFFLVIYKKDIEGIFKIKSWSNKK